MKKTKKHFNITMILGFIGAIVVVSTTVALSTSHPMAFLNLIGLIIVFGAIFTCTLIMQPFSVTVALVKRLTLSIYGKRVRAIDTIAEFIDFSQKKYAGYIIEDTQYNDEILQDSIEMMSIGLNPEDIRRCTELRIENHETDLSKEAGFLITLSKLAPAFGLVGTLLGMILLLNEIGKDASNMDGVGPAMAIALCSTLYGVTLANMIFYPWAEYLGHMAHESILRGQIINEGLSMVHENRHPVQIRETLKSYLNKREQAVLEQLVSNNENRAFSGGDQKVA